VDTAIALAVTIDPSSKVTFDHKGTTCEIVPYEDISEQLDSIMADPARAVLGNHMPQAILSLLL